MTKVIDSRCVFSAPDRVNNLTTMLSNNSIVVSFDPPEPRNGILLFYVITLQ